jgi:hypothetical protein
MIKEKGKLSMQDMIDAILDVHDYQAQLSTHVIISNVKKGLESALNAVYKSKAERDITRIYINEAFKQLENWDYGFQINQTQASIYMAFEVAFYSYFQETKIDEMEVRRGIHGNVITDNFIYKEIHKWDGEKDPIYDYCFLEVYA